MTNPMGDADEVEDSRTKVRPEDLEAQFKALGYKVLYPRLLTEESSGASKQCPHKDARDADS